MARNRILIVDDEDAILFAMAEYFSIHGFDVDSTRQQEEALAFLERKPYAVIIADLRLAGTQNTEGLELADQVRERWPSTRMILLTAYGSPHIEAEARARGVHAFVNKPYPLPDLLQVVLDLIADHPPGPESSEDRDTSSDRAL